MSRPWSFEPLTEAQRAALDRMPPRERHAVLDHLNRARALVARACEHAREAAAALDQAAARLRAQAESAEDEAQRDRHFAAFTETVLLAQGLRDLAAGVPFQENPLSWYFGARRDAGGASGQAAGQ